ncbi:MAG TPA: hypothetical protein VMU37_01835, partial [Caulobacteraceae bacterium]|nr:hypothetical protein [Caulobacteraceae bacterium]
CQRLDGIPLAIEMAAARAPSLGCDGVLQRLDDRFRILTGGRRTALPRQRTLQATLDWSHGLLPPEDAAVFRRLGVFTGGFSLEAASRVAADEQLDAVEVIDALSSLVAKSLVAADTEDNRTRYRLLETTRMYALERLAEAGETAAVRRRHAEYFTRFSENARDDYYGLSDEAFFARYVADLGNVEQALEWAFGPDGDSEIGVALTGYSWTIWVCRSRAAQYLPWSDLALSRITPATPPRVALRTRGAAISLAMQTRPNLAPSLAEAILPELRARNEPRALGDALWSLSQSLLILGRRDEAAAMYAEAVAVTAGLPAGRLAFGVAWAGANLAHDAGDSATEARLLKPAAETASATGAYGWAHLLSLSDTTSSLDRAAIDAGPPELAIQRLRESLARIRPNHMFGVQTAANTNLWLADLLAQRNGPGDLDEAFALVRATEKFNGRSMYASSLLLVFYPALADGRPADAARLLGYAMAVYGAHEINYHSANRRAEALRAALLETLSEAELERLMAEGARLTSEQHFLLATKQED